MTSYFSLLQKKHEYSIDDLSNDIDNWSWEDLKKAAMSTTSTFDLDSAKSTARKQLVDWFKNAPWFVSAKVTSQRVFRFRRDDDGAVQIPEELTPQSLSQLALQPAANKILKKNAISAILSNTLFFGRTTVDALRVMDSGGHTLFLDMRFWNDKGNKNLLTYAFFDEVCALLAHGRKSVILMNIEAKRLDIRPDMRPYIHPKGYLAIKDKTMALNVKTDIECASAMSFYNDKVRCYHKLRYIVQNISSAGLPEVSRENMRPNVNLRAAWTILKNYDPTVTLKEDEEAN